jgi:deoxycytidylate deaminase
MQEDNPFPSIGYFRIARDESLKSSYRIKVGACLSEKRPVSRGFNKLKTYPIFANPMKHIKLSIHAEIACLMQSRAEYKGDTIYVYRERDGKPALSRPCPACMTALKEHGVKHIYYTIEHSPFYAYEQI